MSKSYNSVCIVFLFFKQKTAYEVRISDWSADVCSSDLVGRHHAQSGVRSGGGVDIARRARTLRLLAQGRTARTLALRHTSAHPADRVPDARGLGRAAARVHRQASGPCTRFAWLRSGAALDADRKSAGEGKSVFGR